jgi:hypothetical protein
LLAQQLGGDEIDRTLAPTRLLNHKQATDSVHHVADRLLLPIMKGRPQILRAEPK